MVFYFNLNTFLTPKTTKLFLDKITIGLHELFRISNGLKLALLAIYVGNFDSFKEQSILKFKGQSILSSIIKYVLIGDYT